MTDDRAHALDDLEATRASLRERLVTQRASDSASGEERANRSKRSRLERNARILGDAVSDQWHASPLHDAYEAARPVAEKTIRRNPFAAIALAAGFGVLMGVSPALRRTVVRTGGNLAWRSVGTAALITALWQIYLQYCEDVDAADASSSEPDAGS